MARIQPETERNNFGKIMTAPGQHVPPPEAVVEMDDLVDVQKELELAIATAEPDLKDAIKRGFTNEAVQRSSLRFENDVPLTMSDVFYADNDGNQISLLNMKAYGCTSFHLSKLDLSLNVMKMTVEAAAGAAAEDGRGGALLVEANCKAVCPALQNLLPITADGRIRVAFSGVKLSGNAGLEIKDDSLIIVNNDFKITLEEIILSVTHYVPRRQGGEEIVTSEVSKDSFEKFPLVDKFSSELVYHLRQELTKQLNGVLQRTTSISEILGGSPPLIEAFSTRVASVSSNGNMVVDMILMEVRKNFLKKCAEIVKLPDLKANFSKKIGLVTVHGEFETNDGKLMDLSTIDRVSDVTLSLGVSRASMMVSMSLSKMKVGFDEYRVKFMNIGPTGRIEATIWKNIINMKVSAGISKWKPFAVIDDLKIQYIDHQCNQSSK
ncbi:uncharacterized protein LOC143912256 isoform X2 [Arctopsyche grandis]|uniref:uncharacterized protein LOC143912256 isoform X2 n=1 Tax=Arctopsyche grandis TaxID=121162 RepID=UPI00406D8D97